MDIYFCWRFVDIFFVLGAKLSSTAAVDAYFIPGRFTPLLPQPTQVFAQLRL